MYIKHSLFPKHIMSACRQHIIISLRWFHLFFIRWRRKEGIYPPQLVNMHIHTIFSLQIPYRIWPKMRTYFRVWLWLYPWKAVCFQSCSGTFSFFVTWYIFCQVPYWFRTGHLSGSRTSKSRTYGALSWSFWWGRSCLKIFYIDFAFPFRTMI